MVLLFKKVVALATREGRNEGGYWILCHSLETSSINRCANKPIMLCENRTRMTCQTSEYDNRMFMLSLKLTHMTSEIHHASCQQQSALYARHHPSGRLSIGLGAVLLVNVNHDNYYTYL